MLTYAGTGDKAALPALIFAVGFLLEDLGQYRPAALVYMECVRTIEHLQVYEAFSY
jgi:hypothetical protein